MQRNYKYIDEQMQIVKDEITAIKNFQQTYGLKTFILHFYSECLENIFWMYIAEIVEKAVPGCEVSYMIFSDDLVNGFSPIITHNALYLVEGNQVNDDIVIKEMSYYKEQCEKIKNKLNSSFSLKAPANIVALENKKLDDFEKRWTRASIAYCFI